MKKLRIGFMGTGYIAEVHAQSLAKLPDIEIRALYNHNLPKAQAFNRKHAAGGAQVFDDWERMLEVPLDAVYLCLPPGANIGQAEAAAARGIHLMLEKPIALTAERAEAIAAAVHAAGVKCQIGHHMRHTAPVRKLKQMLGDGSAGRPLLMQGRFFVNQLFPIWWRSPLMGGGQLIEQAIHIYDLARHFFGEPSIVCAFADRIFHERFADYQVDDASASVIQFRNSAIASLCAANCYEPHMGSMPFSVLCEYVTVEFRNADEAIFAIHGGRKTEEISADDVRHEAVRSDGSAYDELSRNFIGAIREEVSLRSGIDDGVRSLALVLAAAQSAASGGAPQTLHPA